MERRINTAKMLSNDGYYQGGIDAEVINNTEIAISPLISDQYEFAVTEDIVMLQDREDTTRKLYEIFEASPFRDEFVDPSTHLIKIGKDDVKKVFDYMKMKLLEVKTLSTYELIIAINEFFDFNYEFVVKKVLSSKDMSSLLEDFYLNMGMANRIDEETEDKLF